MNIHSNINTRSTGKNFSRVIDTQYVGYYKEVRVSSFQNNFLGQNELEGAESHNQNYQP